MAITPRQAMGITQAERQKVDKLEVLIDEHLQKNFGRYDKRSVSYEPPYGISQPILQELRQRYAEAGWKVTYSTSPKNESYLKLEVIGTLE